MSFCQWLKTNGAEPFTHKEYQIIKIERSQSFDYLYMGWTDGRMCRGNDFKFAGIYHRTSEKIFCASWSLSNACDPTLLDGRSEEEVSGDFVSGVRAKVNEIINDNKANLSITKVESWSLNQSLEYAAKYGAYEVARSLFVNKGKDAKAVYRCGYNPRTLSDEMLLFYIDSPEEAVLQSAKKFIEDNQEGILANLLKNELVNAELEKIRNDTSRPEFMVQRIMSAVKSCDAKTVNVTINKGGVELAFKTDTSPLVRDCPSGKYSSWEIVAQDRRKFEELFGRWTDYAPEEIVRIMYRGKVVYEKNA